MREGGLRVYRVSRFLQATVLNDRYQVLESSETDDWFMARSETESMASARMFVLGLGAGAVVLEPEELNAAVLEQARAVIDQRHHV